MGTLTQRPQSLSLAGASILGRNHAALRRNRQDAIAYASTPWGAWGVVADGCGSGRASELGALVSATAMERAIAEALARGASPRDALVDGISDVRGALAWLAERCSTVASRSAFVGEHLLATVVAFAITRERGALVAVGDGIAFADGESFVFDEGNAPSYLGYAAIGGPVAAPNVVELDRFDCLAVASDGFDGAAIEAASGYVCAPGHARPNALARYLRVQQQGGAFADDASIVVAWKSAGGAS